MSELTSEYIEQHLHAVHTHDSFARAVVESVLRHAAQKADGSESIEIPATFTISRNVAAGCVKVCYNGPDGRTVCIHQPG